MLIPVSSEEDAKAITKSIETLQQAKEAGANAHLRKAAELLSAGKFSDSVRESIHAVESTVKSVTGKANAKLSDGLKHIEKATHVPDTLKTAFIKLYAYTNAEKGIRHASIDGDDIVDESLALFMFAPVPAFAPI